MSYIITPNLGGWGDWKDLAEKAKLKVSSEQYALGDALIGRNPCEKVKEERFIVQNPLISCEPATFFYNSWGMREEYKTLHPIHTLAALAAWGGNFPERCWNLTSPHVLADGNGGNYILCINYLFGKDGTEVVSFVPTTEWVNRPAFVIGLTHKASEYERCWPIN